MEILGLQKHNKIPNLQLQYHFQDPLCYFCVEGIVAYMYGHQIMKSQALSSHFYRFFLVMKSGLFCLDYTVILYIFYSFSLCLDCPLLIHIIYRCFLWVFCRNLIENAVLGCYRLCMRQVRPPFFRTSDCDPWKKTFHIRPFNIFPVYVIRYNIECIKL